MLPYSRCAVDMGELSLSREGFSSYLGVPQELKVRRGDDVVVKCSASSSEEPSYYWNKDVRELLETSHPPSPHFQCNLFIFFSPLLQSL